VTVGLSFVSKRPGSCHVSADVDAVLPVPWSQRQLVAALALPVSPEPAVVSRLPTTTSTSLSAPSPLP
jgi:hypothetical protein